MQTFFKRSHPAGAETESVLRCSPAVWPHCQWCPLWPISSLSVDPYKGIKQTFHSRKACFYSVYLQYLKSEFHSPVHLTAEYSTPPCWDPVGETQTQLADRSEYVPACSPRRCWGEVGHPVDHWHAAWHGGPHHPPGTGGWNWWCQICRQPSGSERSLEIKRGQNEKQRKDSRKRFKMFCHRRCNVLSQKRTFAQFGLHT